MNKFNNGIDADSENEEFGETEHIAGERTRHRDTHISFHFRPSGEVTLDGLSGKTAKERRRQQATKIIFLGASIEALGQNRWIHYSRNKNAYTGQKRYRGKEYTYAFVPSAVDCLEELGVIEHQRAFPCAPMAGSYGYQSRFRLVPDAGLILPKYCCDPFETVRLKDASKRLVDYPETDRTLRMRRETYEINEALCSIEIELESEACVRRGPHIFCQTGNLDDNLQPKCVVINPARNSVYRVFSNGKWNLGGRLYGGWWQNVPSSERTNIHIDGFATVEEDYQQLHPRLLYHFVDKEPIGDAYTIDGWDRPLCKRSFNIAINARTEFAAIGAIQNLVGGPGARECATKLLGAIKNHHRPIERFFHTGIGLTLQHIDSQMASHVVRSMLKQGIVCLPIHDSFIVRAGNQSQLLEVMEEAYCCVI